MFYFQEKTLSLPFKTKNIKATVEKTLRNSHIPEPSLRRLPWYLAFAKLLQGKGDEYVSSTQIARALSVDASMVAKDLSYVEISGKTRVGYEVNDMVNVLDAFLGFTNTHKAFLWRTSFG